MSSRAHSQFLVVVCRSQSQISFCKIHVLLTTSSKIGDSILFALLRIVDRTRSGVKNTLTVIKDGGVKVHARGIPTTETTSS